MDEIKKLLKTDKLIVGTKETLKALRNGTLAKIFTSSNCKTDLSKYSQHVPVTQLSIPNDELGVLCKKQFSISMIGMRK
ncbi:MAG TPA: ribosomal L7Ae/L30e/S12e/Gadd45 family protein [Candidatus Nanoarchaeia archaeon]|nr:ribosomal L7Ae/L30e/S12e/Gadd45 family protein [Candidatus Nanoarchaeia archaeon]